MRCRSLQETYGFCLREMSPESLQDVRVSLPCIVLFQVALVDTLQAAGVLPMAVLGHSTGEISAAYAHGLTKLEDIVRAVYGRALGQYLMPEGLMMALFASEEEFKVIHATLPLAAQARLVLVSFSGAAHFLTHPVLCCGPGPRVGAERAPRSDSERLGAGHSRGHGRVRRRWSQSHHCTAHPTRLSLARHAVHARIFPGGHECHGAAAGELARGFAGVGANFCLVGHRAYHADA